MPPSSFASLSPFPDDEIIAICHHGMRSLQVCNFLEENGFNRMLNLDGGIDSWAKIIDKDMTQY